MITGTARRSSRSPEMVNPIVPERPTGAIIFPAFPSPRGGTLGTRDPNPDSPSPPDPDNPAHRPTPTTRPAGPVLVGRVEARRGPTVLSLALSSGLVATPPRPDLRRVLA